MLLHQFVHGQQEGAFAQLVAVGTIGKMADRTDREDNRDAKVVEYLMPETINHLLHREPTTEELGSRKLVAVGHWLALHGGSGSRVVEEESISGSQRNDNQRIALQKQIGVMYRPIASIKHLRAIGMRETSVMEPRVP